MDNDPPLTPAAAPLTPAHVDLRVSPTSPQSPASPTDQQCLNRLPSVPMDDDDLESQTATYTQTIPISLNDPFRSPIYRAESRVHRNTTIMSIPERFERFEHCDNPQKEEFQLIPHPS